MIADQLKKAVLQAAIQGNLTEQLPEDGDARDLLKEIQHEKARLFKEGKIKKVRPLPEITVDEIPFEIPDNWVWCRLGDIGVWAAGATPLKSNTKYYLNGTIPWLKTGDLNDYVIESIPDNITALAVKETSVKIQPPGTVLIAMYGATIGKLGLLNISATTNQACCGCNTFNGLFNWFLFYYLLAHRQDFINQGAGGAQPNISREKIVLNLIPIPPLSEQHRIVDQLEIILSEIQKLEKDETKLDALQKTFPLQMKNAILQAAIQGKLTEQLPEDGDARDLLKEIQQEKARLVKEGKLKPEKPLPPITEDEIPFEIPENWTWVRLSEISFNISSKPFQIFQKEILKVGKFPVVSQGKDLIEGYSNSKEKLLVHKEPIIVFGDHTKNLKFIEFDFIVGADGTKLLKSILLNSMFLFYALQFILTNLPTRNYGRHFTLLSLKYIPLPPLAEQYRIVSRLEELLPLCEALE